MQTLAVVLQQPEQLVLSQLDLSEPSVEDVVVAIHWSGISTGTERLLWSGKMPPFPGMGYPLVPGYESVGRIESAGKKSGRMIGEQVFVPGARCFGKVRGLFGGAAAKLVVPGARVMPVADSLGENAVLLALAATAYHAMTGGSTAPANPLGIEQPELIIGHGVLGRILARLAVLNSPSGRPGPVVWESNPSRRHGGQGYPVIDPAEDDRNDYRAIYDVSGDAASLDSLISRLAPGGEIVLAGFYSTPLSFTFPPAFMKEARLRVAAEWREADLAAVRQLAETGRLSLQDLITHRHEAAQADAAYKQAFSDPACLKMILDWRTHV